MQFQTKQIKGVGRGHKIGFPTINLVVPENLELEEGIYASFVNIEGQKYKGALHYGSIPTFNQSEKTMEVHLLDITDKNVPETLGKWIGVDIVSKIRNVWSFDKAEDLASQIGLDIEKVRQVLK